MPDGILGGAIIGGVIGLIYAGLMMWRARRAKGDKYLAAMTKRVIRIEAAQAPEAVYAALSSGVTGRSATLEARDAAARRIVYADQATMTTFGFFYPIHIAPGADGGSSIDVGIASRGNQWGPLVTKAHEIFADGVKATLGVSA